MNQFKQNYEKLFKNKKISKNDFIWMMLGFDPAAVKAYEDFKKEQALNTEAEKFCRDFENYDHNKMKVHPLGVYFHILNTVIKGNKLDKLIAEAYKHRFLNSQIHNFADEEFLNHLINTGQMPHMPELERYKDYSQFSADLGQVNISEIKTSHEAVSFMLGLEPENFQRYRSLFELANKTGDGLNPYYGLSEDNKWFIDEYTLALKELFPELDSDLFHVRNVILPFYDATQAENYDFVAFTSYIQKLHDEGFIFPSQSYEALKNKGIPISYSPDSWAINFYIQWADEGAWTLLEAIDLFCGRDPRIREREAQGLSILSAGKPMFKNFHDLTRNRHLIIKGGSVNGTGEINSVWKAIESNSPVYIDLEDRLENHIAANKIIPLSNGKFAPKAITEWLQKNTLATPPDAILEVLGLQNDLTIPIEKISKKRGRPKGTGIDDSKAILFIEQKVQQKKISRNKAASDAYDKFKRDNETLDTFAGRIRRKMSQ
ncbi:MAG: hypothetical protein ACK4VI_00450 [Alphaproteobacteria bacterium]